MNLFAHILEIIVIVYLFFENRTWSGLWFSLVQDIDALKSELGNHYRMLQEHYEKLEKARVFAAAEKERSDTFSDRLTAHEIAIQAFKNTPNQSTDYHLKRFDEIFTRLVKLETKAPSDSVPHVPPVSAFDTREVEPMTLLEFMTEASRHIAENPAYATAILGYEDVEYDCVRHVGKVEWSPYQVTLNGTFGPVGRLTLKSC
jgi:hypothetical protein